MIRLLLDRYERSLLFEGKNSRTIHIMEKLTRENFPEYFDESSIEFEEIHSWRRKKSSPCVGREISRVIFWNAAF